VGRRPLIVAGMLLQAGALALLAASGGAVGVAAAAAVALGLGTALVYPTLIAAISDLVEPVARAPALGVYRFWRDMGYVVGGLVAGGAADAFGFATAIGLVAALTAASGAWAAFELPARSQAALRSWTSNERGRSPLRSASENATAWSAQPHSSQSSPSSSPGSPHAS
jgi:MFS family permease